MSAPGQDADRYEDRSDLLDHLFRRSMLVVGAFAALAVAVIVVAWLLH